MNPKLRYAIGIDCFHSGLPFFVFDGRGRPRFDLGFRRTEDEADALIKALLRADTEG